MSQVLQCTQFCALIWKRGLPSVVVDHLVDPRRAIALRGLAIDRQVDRDRDRRVVQLQVDRLVFLVVGVGEERPRTAGRR